MVLVLGLLVPHNKAVLLIHADCFLVKIRILYSQLFQEIYTELLSSLPSLDPNSFKIASVTEVLSNCNRKVKIQYPVPPATRHKHSFAWVLDALDYCVKLSTALKTFLLFKSRQN